MLLLCTFAFAADPTLYPLHIAGHRPPCAEVEGLPITPEDPGAVVTGRGTRCYGTDPRELVLMMPLDAPVWLETAAPHPAEWIRVGPVLVDAQRFQVPPLGLKLMEGGDALVLETRFGRAATLTRLTPGRWLPVESADGERYWMMVETGRNGPSGD